MREGTVYTETVIHSAPQEFSADAPYQIAILEFTNADRQLVRIRGQRVNVGDAVTEVECAAYPLFESKK